MGLSELLAEVVHEATQQASRLPAGRHSVSGACPEKAVKLLGSDGIAVHLLRMPYSVTEDRVFAHIGYYFEHKGQPVPVETEAAWQIGSEAVILA
jgi:CRISPR-associated protein Cas5h